MNTHSHGPWRASFFAGRWCVLHKGGDDTTILATCSNEADARMMAASLMMHDALKSMLETHGKPHREEWLNDAGFQHAQAVDADARNALAWAGTLTTGE